MRQAGGFSAAVVAAIIGVLSGAAVVIDMRLTTRGWWVLLPYALLMLTSIIYFRRAGIGGFGRRFALAFETYFLTTLIAYGYASAINHRAIFADLGRHAWHLLLLLGIGAAGCLVLAGIPATLRDQGRAQT